MIEIIITILKEKVDVTVYFLYRSNVKKTIKNNYDSKSKISISYMFLPIRLVGLTGCVFH